MDNPVVFQVGDRVKYLGDSKDVAIHSNDVCTVVEAGDIPSKVFKDPKCSSRPLAYELLSDGGLRGIVYPSEMVLA